MIQKTLLIIAIILIVLGFIFSMFLNSNETSKKENKTQNIVIIGFILTVIGIIIFAIWALWTAQIGVP